MTAAARAARRLATALLREGDGMTPAPLPEAATLPPEPVEVTV